MSKIEIKQLTFSYPGQEKKLFEQANLNLDSDWKLGLFGRNGRGKTTLLKLLQDQLEYRGQISHQVSFNYFPQEIIDPGQLAIYALGQVASFEEWQLEKELNLMQVDPEILWRPFKSLSGGEQTKLKLALLFIDQNHFSLIDEPTNHLDLESRKQVVTYLSQKKQGFIVVSHDRQFVDEICDHILVIEKAQISLYHGNYATYEQEKQLSDNFEIAQNEKLQKDIDRLKQTALEKEKWSGTREKDKRGDPRKKGSGAIFDTGHIGARAARVMKRSKVLEKRMENEIQNKEKLLKNIEQIDQLALNFQPGHQQKLLRVENLELFYEESRLFEPVTFEIERGQQVGLMGSNGIGKTSIIEALSGNFPGKQSGSVRIPPKIKISYIRQDFEYNPGYLAEFARNQGLDYEMFLNNLHKLGVERSVFTQKIENMSMGQRKRVEVAKSLSQPAELYIWDEPLNYLDIYNQNQLIKLIADVKPTLLLIEHDQQFIKKVTNELVQLKR
ncbi:ribosomal protection-like ABC-F family protein [Ligilactobacillus pobuzihii]|uniref:ABC transporter ATP-binding protein n=1 Tax=Ligilactobacillus pobuzihii TaxID=449659 RepID=A0A0R2LK66_9LACO|nr:ABC-F type ribosomal protection protein [Ligilactobacillus pobuzihii]KRK09346.1 ABC transporter ATP-binding protein [Ligilactobacillus pobuzihii E100301 = KCTC 13174]KRN98516.1 ABC transporter ATP-binding protein [Ligilactobacillus pobuzihii]GEN48543.1 Lsa family ABC-F type ribosomal protection protein [Ligilactobacillus pobuzihii]